MTKTIIFLTGATGTMGFAGMTEILRYPERYELRVLARPSKKNKELLSPLSALHPQLHIIWGDLTNYNDVLQGVKGADIVLHVGGMVSPQADYRPKATLRTNISAAENITKAILAQPEEKQPKVVYIGSVAQMGDRREPLHWGRAGDPICVSAYDHYGLTKALAERIITDSGNPQELRPDHGPCAYPRRTGMGYGGGQRSITGKSLPSGGAERVLVQLLQHRFRCRVPALEL